jgi:tRNA G18 (ribose-2'-O)-methylase SpoU
MAESDLLIERALRAGFTPLSVLVDVSRQEPLPPLPDSVQVFAGTLPVIHRITGLALHRGSLGLFSRRSLPDAVSLIERARRLVVLAGVVNPTNVGVIVRSAAAFGFDAMLLDKDCSDPLYRRASRVSMGTVYGCAYATIPRLPGGLALLQEYGFVTVGFTPAAAAESLQSVRFAPQDRVAVVLGSEGYGLSDDTLAALDRRVRIPIAPNVDSLNVAAAAAVACYAFSSL